MIVYFLVMNSKSCTYWFGQFRSGGIKNYSLEIRVRNKPSSTHSSNTSLENPSNIDNFSKLSKRQIVLTITGRGNTIKKTQYLATNINNPNGKLLYI